MTHAHQRFEDLFSLARSGDLAPRTVLTDTECFAVQLGGLAALDLDPAMLTAELSVLLEEGCPSDLAEDTFVQMATYLGYPKARQSLACLKNALEAAGRSGQLREPPASQTSATERRTVGTDDYARLNPNALDTINGAFGELAPDVIDMTFRFFGDVYAASRQPLVLRQLSTVTALAVLGSAAPQLRFHIGAGMYVGLTTEQLVEVVAWVQFFAGAPAAYNALIELKTSLAEGTSATPAYK